jgi:hypothetical protein
MIVFLQMNFSKTSKQHLRDGANVKKKHPDSLKTIKISNHLKNATILFANI